MKAFMAFMRKELQEQLRSGRLLLLGILFALFGVMNPAIAKLTPWIIEILADSLAASGMTVAEVHITALDSWVQFYKNIPMGLIAFVLLESSIFTKEYSSGTLILWLTKGLDRRKVVISKAAVLTVLWSLSYWLCFGITYGYNAWFWDNSLARELLFSAVCWWVFGLWVLGLAVLFSVAAKTNTGVLCGTGGVVFGSYLLSMLPKFGKYLPAFLTDGNSLIYGMVERKDYLPALIVAGVTGAACFAVSIPVFDKKQL